MNPIILITGSNGFIGQYVTPLCKIKYNILSPSHDELDLMDEKQVGRYIKKHRPTHLIHLAWITTPGVYKDSHDNIKWVSASENLFKEFLDGGGRNIIGIGTNQEYDQEYKYFLEDHTPEKSNNLYGTTKTCTKNILEEWCRRKDARYAWLRIFNIYGYNEPKNKLVSSIIRSLEENKIVKINTPHMVLDYVYVKDVAKIVVDIVEIIECKNLRTLNVCSGIPISTMEIANYIGEKMHKGDLISYNLESPVSISVGNNSKLKNVLQTPIKYSVKSGIDEIIKEISLEQK